MKTIVSIAAAFIIIAGIAIGGYYGNEVYKEKKYVNTCVEKMFSDTTDIAKQKADEPVARHYCTCVYKQMDEGVPEGWAEFGCAFDTLIRLSPESDEE